VGFSAPRAVKKNCTEGCKRDFVYKYSLEEKQTHAECQHTSLGERRGHRGFVSTQLVDKASAVDQRDCGPDQLDRRSGLFDIVPQSIEHGDTWSAAWTVGSAVRERMSHHCVPLR
jgi:hypothetical protein